MAIRQQPQHVELARRELGQELLSGLLFVPHLALAGDGLGEEADGDEDLADRCLPDSFDDLVSRGRLGQVGDGPGVDGVEQGVLRLLGAVKHDRRGWRRRANPGGGRGPAQVGKPEVHQHHRGCVLGSQDRRLLATPGYADHCQILLVVEDARDRRGKQRMVLHDQHPNRKSERLTQALNVEETIGYEHDV